MTSVTDADRRRDSASRSVRVEYDETDLSPSLAVIESIADIADVDSKNLYDETGIVINDYIDPDALDKLVMSSSNSYVDITLAIGGYDITVDDSAVTTVPLTD